MWRLLSLLGSEAPLRHPRAEDATPRLFVEVAPPTSLTPVEPDDIIKRVLLRPVSGALAVSPPGRATESVQPFNRIEQKTMSNGEQENWSRVKERLRAEAGVRLGVGVGQIVALEMPFGRLCTDAGPPDEEKKRAPRPQGHGSDEGEQGQHIGASMAGAARVGQAGSASVGILPGIPCGRGGAGPGKAF